MLLLFFFAGGHGTFFWFGPNPRRTVVVDREDRTVRVY